jgi:hypothetical protein
MRGTRLASFIAAAALWSAGCGDSGGSSPDAAVDKTAAFVGSWMVAGGELLATCPNAPMGFPPEVKQMLERAAQPIIKGTMSDLVIGVLPGCNVMADVADKVATIRADQMCNFMFMSFPVQGTIKTGNYTLTDSGASFAYTGTAAIGTIMCTVSATGTSVRSTASDAGASAGG